MLAYKYGQTIISTAIATNFRGHYNNIFTEKRKRDIFFPRWELNRCPVGSKAHTLQLSHLGLVGLERKHNICKRNILRAQKNAERFKCECA